MKSIESNRNFMKSNFDSWQSPTPSDQMQGVPAPDLQKKATSDVPLISLPKALAVEADLYETLMHRRSVRTFSDEAMSLEELSFMLEASCRIQKVIGDNVASFRPAPSGGARHPFETYIAVRDVKDLEAGYYHYLPLTHQLERLSGSFEAQTVIDSVNGQKFAGSANVTFYLSAVPYRAEWRYGLRSHKVMLLDLGHLAQNIYLSAEGIGAGACGIASYDQEKSNAIFNLDGDDEYIVYILPVGKKIK